VTAQHAHTEIAVAANWRDLLGEAQPDVADDFLRRRPNA
jgi:hypothetical protein